MNPTLSSHKRGVKHTDTRPNTSLSSNVQHGIGIDSQRWSHRKQAEDTPADEHARSINHITICLKTNIFPMSAHFSRRKFYCNRADLYRVSSLLLSHFTLDTTMIVVEAVSLLTPVDIQSVCEIVTGIFKPLSLVELSENHIQMSTYFFINHTRKIQLWQGNMNLAARGLAVEWRFLPPSTKHRLKHDSVEGDIHSKPFSLATQTLMRCS